MAVFFNESGRLWQEWKIAPLFRNVGADDRVYDQFYNYMDQLGVRCGNGVFGHMPIKDTQVKILAWLTVGESSLMPNQPLRPIDPDLVSHTIEFVSAETIAGGKAFEGIEEIRRNALYYPLYNHKIVWNDDYAFYLKRMIPDILWIHVWGEAEQEAMTKQYDVKNINTIFISAYTPSITEPQLQEKISTCLSELPLLNRHYRYVQREDIAYIIYIEAVLSRSVGLKDARVAIKASLSECYGKNATKPTGYCHIKDVYKILNSLGLFASQRDIFVYTAGQTEPEKLSQMVYADIDKTMAYLSLSY